MRVGLLSKIIGGISTAEGVGNKDLAQVYMIIAGNQMKWKNTNNKLYN